MIARIVLNDLHGIYNYDITLKENVTILTGPNGYGKTTILKIITAIHEGKYEYLCKLQYSRIAVYYKMPSNYMIVSINKGLKTDDTIESEDQNSRYSDTIQITLSKSEEDMSSNEVLEQFDVSLENRSDEERSIYRFYQTINGKTITEKKENNVVYDKDKCRNFDMFIKEQKCSFIAEQRILKTEQNEFGEASTGYVIKDIANELKTAFNHCQVQFSKKSQQIDASFMSRLMDDECEACSEEDYKMSIERLIQKMERLREYGLVPSGEIVEKYSEAQSKVLSLYIKDMESKLSAYDSLFNKLSLFDKIVSSKVLSHKKISLNSKSGLSVNDENYRKVPLDKLSSGEQNLIILYYKLVFLHNSKSILLIDEPENSLHIAWLTKMLDDYINISKLLGCQIILATHSPAFINDNWDITFDLEDKAYQE